MSPDGFHEFEKLFAHVDSATANFVTDISTAAIATVTPVLAPALALGFVLYGLAVIQGMVQTPIGEFLRRSFFIAVVVSVASLGGIYQSTFADAIQTTPDALAGALIPDGDDATTAAALVDHAAQTGFDRSGEAFEHAGVFVDNGIVFALIGLVILLATAALVAVGGAFLLLAKLALALLVGLGPLFVLALLFAPTRRLFTAWAAQVLTYGLLLVLFAAVFGLMMRLFGDYLASMTMDGSQNMAYALGGVVVLAVAMVMVLLQLPSLAAALGGGVGLGTYHEWRTVRGLAGSPGRVIGRPERLAGGGRPYRAPQGALGVASQGVRVATAAVGRFQGARRSA